MTLHNPPSWLQNGSHPAENDRLTTKALWNTTGIIGSSSLAVSASSPAGMSVVVASGWAAIVGNSTTNMGTYVAYNDANVTLTITAADPSNPRIDRVVATVRDSYYSGSDDDVIFQVIAGTPAASPSAPATPNNSISLATVSVAAGASTIVGANITDTRVVTTTNADFVTLTGTQTLTNKTLTEPVATIAFNAQTGTTYTLVAGDASKMVTLSNANPISLTVPLNSSVPYPIGTIIALQQLGAGQVTVAGAVGVTVNGTPGLKLRAQYSTAALIKRATDTWTIAGDLSV